MKLRGFETLGADALDHIIDIQFSETFLMELLGKLLVYSLFLLVLLIVA